jgi:hypothetical protein
MLEDVSIEVLQCHCYHTRRLMESRLGQPLLCLLLQAVGLDTVNFYPSERRTSSRNKDGRCISTSLLDSVSDIRKNRLAQVCLASFLWIRTSNDIGPYRCQSVFLETF